MQSDRYCSLFVAAFILLVTFFNASVVCGTFRYLWQGQLNNSGAVAFSAGLEDGSPDLNGLFLRPHDDTLRAVAALGGASPVPELTYQEIGDFYLNSRNNILFGATLQNGDMPLKGVFLYLHDERRVKALVLPQDAAIDHPIQTVSALGLNDQDQAIFWIDLVITPCSDPTKCKAVTEARFYEYDRNRDELALLAQEGGQATGGGTFTTIGRPCAINGRGTVVFRGQGSEPGVSSFNDLFIKRSSSSPVERLYVSGPGTDLYLPASVQLTDSDASPVLFSAYYPNPSAPPYGGLFGLTEEGLNTLTTDGQTVDNIEINLRFMSGFLGQYTEHFDPPATVLLNDGLVIFTDHLNNTFATSIQNEPLVFLSGESQPVVIEGRSYVPLLQGPAAGPTDGPLVGPHNDAGQVAFRTTEGDLLIFDPSSGFHRALDHGSPVPGTAQSVFDTIEPLDMNDTQVLFSGTFSLSQSGLFLLDTQTGVLQKVVARNEVAPGAPLSLTHVFPQFADGSYEDGSIKTALLLVNSTSFENVVSLNFRRSDGSAANVSIGGETAEHFSFSLAPKGSALVQTQAIGAIQNGYVLVESAGEMAASEIFSVFDAEGSRLTEAGVLPSLPGRHFTLGVEAQNDVNTGVALVNLSGEEADLVFTARDQAGNIVASTERTLGPNEHLAEYVAGELFTDVETLVGSVEVVSSVEVHKLTLRSGAHSLTTLPIAD